MNFKKVLVSELKPAKYNPRKDLKPTDPEFQRIKKSIEEFGYVDPVIVNSDNTVIGGHQRLKVLKELGHAEIDVVVLDIPKTKEKALNVALNKITGEWDMRQLSIVLTELKEEDFDISITGFTDKELKDIDIGLFGDKIDFIPHDPDSDRAGASPWDRMGGKGSDGVVLTFGEITAKIETPVYESFLQKVRANQSQSAYISEVLRNASKN